MRACSAVWTGSSPCTLLESLEETAIEQDSLPVKLEQVLGAGDRARGLAGADFLGQRFAFQGERA